MKKILNDPFSQELTLKVDSPNFSIDNTYDIEYYDYDFDQNILTHAELYYKSLDQIYPILTKYNPSYIELESYEYDKQSPYPVKYELLYKSFNRYITIKEIVSDNGKARFSNLIPGYIYYIKAIDTSNQYNSKIVKFIPEDYDPEIQPEILTTYFGNSWDNFKYNFITSNVFGEKTIYLENNKPHIKLKQIDNKRYEISLLEIKNKADEFDLVLEDHRSDKIIKIIKRIYINDGFSTPYNISIEFTDSNAAIFKWSIDGIYEINKFYISDNTINKGNPIDVIGTSTYIITNYDTSKTQYLWLSSLRDGKEKFSDPITIDSFDRSINPLIGPSVNYSINHNNDLAVYLNHNSTTVDNYSVYLEENEITSIDGLTPIVTSTSKNIVIPNFDVYNNYDRTLKLLATTNKYNHGYMSENKDLYVAYDWTPDKLLTSLWLDSSDSSNIVITSGAVSQWKDKSGNNNHFIQTNQSQMPVLNKGIYFNGSNRLLGNNNSLSISKAIDSLCVYVVAKIEGGQDYRTIINSSIDGVTSARVGIYGRQSGTVESFGRRIIGDSGQSVGVSISSKLSLISGIFDYKNAKLYVGLNGVYTQKSGDFQTPGSTANADSAYFSIGHHPVNNTEGFIGFIHEIIICKYILSNQDEKKMEGYLAHKYGLTDNLPVDHPYKTKRPIIDHTPINLTTEFKND